MCSCMLQTRNQTHASRQNDIEKFMRPKEKVKPIFDDIFSKKYMKVYLNFILYFMV